MKLCFVSTEFPPETAYGGISTFMQTATRLLAQRGHEVTVVTVTRGDKDIRETVEGVQVWKFSEPRYRSTLREDLRRNWQVWQAVRELQPDIVQLVEYGAEGFLLAWMAHKRYKLITRLTWQGDLTRVRKEYPFQIRRRLISILALQQVLRSRVVFAPSVRLARMIEQDSKLKPDSIRQIVTSVNLAELRAFKETEPSFKPGAPYLIYFGRLEERKGVHYLAQALPMVWEKIPNIKMVFIGLYESFKLEGQPARQYIEQAAGKYISNLIFIDRLPRHEVLPIVARARLVLLPSIWENYANACIEAIALGVPVVATEDSGGLAEIVGGLYDKVVEPGSVPAGWLVPRRNAPALASAIIEALTDEEAMAQAIEHTKLRARRFDAERMVDELEALYREVAGSA